MANPYGMTEFSVPALIGLNEQMKSNRLEQMYRQKDFEYKDKQMQQQEREWALDEKKRAAMARIFGGGDPASTATAPADGDLPVAPPADGDPAPQDVAQDRGDGLKINQQALRELYAVDPQGAAQLQEFVGKAEKAQIEHLQQRGEIMAAAAYALKNFPPAERKAHLQAMAPELIARGFSQDEIIKADVSDAGLQRYLTFGQSLKDLVDQQNKDRTFSESQRHNRAAEGVAAGALGLARQREGRVSAGGGGGGGSDTSTDALLSAAGLK